MPVATHTKAANHHEAAAKAHKAAAVLHGDGDHAAAVEKSIEANECCGSAQKQTAEAHSKSTAHQRT